MIDDARWQLRPDVMVAGMIHRPMVGWVMEGDGAFDNGGQVAVRFAHRPIGREPDRS